MAVAVDKCNNFYYQNNIALSEYFDKQVFIKPRKGKDFHSHQKDILIDMRNCENRLEGLPNILSQILAHGMFLIYNHLTKFPLQFKADHDIRILLHILKRIKDYDAIPKEDKEAIHSIFKFLLAKIKKNNTNTEPLIGTKEWFREWKNKILAFKDKEKNISSKRGYTTNSGLSENILPSYVSRKYRSTSNNGFSRYTMIDKLAAVDKLYEFLYGEKLPQLDNSKNSLLNMFQKKGLVKNLTFRNRLNRTLRKWKQKYTTMKYHMNPKKARNEDRLRTLKLKYRTKRDMNLPKAIETAMAQNLPYQTLKATLEKPKLMKATNANRRTFEKLTTAYTKNLQKAKVLYRRRSTTRKLMNRLKKKIATLLGRE
jgi:hypothetical protein